jgi:hypothetical protein
MVPPSSHHHLGYATHESGRCYSLVQCQSRGDEPSRCHGGYAWMALRSRGHRIEGTVHLVWAKISGTLFPRSLRERAG